MSSEQPHLGALESLVGYRLRRAWSAFSADFAAAMEGTGLRQVPLAVLSIIAANPGINQGATGRALGIKRANMVALINELVEKQWIERATDANDRRALTLTLTTAGEAVMAEALQRIEGHENRMLSDMQPEERSLLLDLLSRIERRSPSAEAEDLGNG
ncbi:MarR family winged helix-turn-helix transcriptional regulator [Sphingomonas pokkalii]|uniref:MarR family transcriptional regulator n=1 Tax=Sphingomonas pokkalii TaxID=2175090 RepID=A0A2U0SCK6_9SPHN|nr:MarR family transcriptional regulator [Sphingomonas pokkalii]PVX29107.1 MarR family transcriptional regulator [Sphingomonas pokkalii]